ELVEKLTTADQKKVVENYVREAQKKSEVERQANKEKTGVFTGAYAVNPVNDTKIPVWVADYVLGGYGTGAIMAVPAHDERDQEFAKTFDLPIIDVIDENNKLINSDKFDGTDANEAREIIVRHLEKTKQAEPKVNYRMNDWSVSRQRYWGAPIPIVNCPKDGAVLVPEDQLPIILPELDDFQPSGDGRSALARATDWLEVDCPKCGGKAERETDTLDTYICSSWYFLRYFDAHNQQQAFGSDVANKWMPIDFYNGADHATAHMLYARFVTRFFTKIGLLKNPEPFKQFLFNGKVTASDGQMFSKSKGNGVDPLDIIDQGYGADALRTYLMFAAPLELWAKWDPQGVPATHRFISRVWNLVQEYNATVIPSEVEESVTDLSTNVRDDTTDTSEVLRAVHKMIKKVTEDVEGNRYNTAIAAMMECTNDLYKLKTGGFGKSDVWQEALQNVVACMAPFAPHAAEDLWHQLGHSTTVHKDSWPKFDEKYLATDEITVIVQINGKLRGNLQVAADADEKAVVEAVKADSKIAGYLEGQTIKKTIYVAGKLVNFVI
ncbi:MAG TPA: leucine--tRNA ligase, partial [Candidatus Saccharimonadales bacterium]|nr:leucine--tRNA ligase [Candidatus Saccharimonadales bacterium]